jgi:hypothetical protein
VQKVLLAPKQVISEFKRNIKGRDLSIQYLARLNKREFGAKNPCWGTGMQFAPL